MGREAEIINLDEDDGEFICNQSYSHLHFEELGEWDWCCIADEGMRLLTLAIDGGVADFSPVEDYLPAGAIVCGVARGSSFGAYASVAAALGVDAHALELACAPWYESKGLGELPPSVSLDKFLDLVKEAKKELDENPIPPFPRPTDN